jgi:hypothetical protein
MDNLIVSVLLLGFAALCAAIGWPIADDKTSDIRGVGFALSAMAGIAGAMSIHTMIAPWL